jgi:hypothetical protein
MILFGFSDQLVSFIQDCSCAVFAGFKTYSPTNKITNNIPKNSNIANRRFGYFSELCFYHA